MDLTLRTEAFQSENQSWLGSAHGTEEADPITLDGTTLGTLFPTGVIPSGVVLGKITGTGLYGPYFPGGAATTSNGGSGANAVTVPVHSTTGFAPASVASPQTAHSGSTDFTYTGIVAGVSLTGCVGAPAIADAAAVTQAANTDGRQNPVGHLLTTTELFSLLRGDPAGVFHNIPAALFWHGEVVVANLPANSGYASAVATAIPLIRYV